MKNNNLVQSIRPEFIIISLIVFFFGKNLFLIDGSFIGGIDVYKYFYWHEVFIKEQILSGNIPLWNPYYYSGHPFLANPQTFVFYPAKLFYLLLPLPLAFNIDTILHIIIAAIGTYYLVFAITRSKKAGIASSFIYSLSGYFMTKIVGGHLTMIHTAALLPWIFYFIEKAFKTENKLFLAISGVIFGFQILGGEPQNNYYTGSFCLLFFLLRLFFISPFIPSKEKFRFGLYFLIIPIIAFGISAIQILPSLEFISLSDRAEKSYEFATAFSFPIQNIYTLLVAQPESTFSGYGYSWDGSEPFSLLIKGMELGCYIGILPLILAGIGAAFSKHRRYSLGLGIMILISASIMFGQYTPIYYLYYKIIPGISLFRIPARCVIIFLLSISILSGFGIHYLSNSYLSRKQQCLTISGIIILIILLLVGAKFFLIPFNSKEFIYAISLMIGSLIILKLLKIIKSRRLTISMCLIAIFLDLYIIYSFQIPKLYPSEVTRTRDYEYVFLNDPGLYRVNISISDLALRGIKLHYYGTNGYSPIVLNDYYKFILDMADLEKPKLTRHTLNPLLFDSRLVFKSKILGIKYALVKINSRYELLIAKRIMPKATLVKKAVILPQKKHIDYIKRPDFDPESEVLLESIPNGHEMPTPKAKSNHSNNTVTIDEYKPNRIELSSFSNENTYLVLSELFYPGWHAYVDEKEIQIQRADYLLRAIPLSSGRHNIVFVYRPLSFIMGAAISILTLIFLTVFLIYTFRKLHIKTSS